MKKIHLLLLCYLLPAATSQAQSLEVQQLLLNVEKLSQFKQILSDLKKGYQLISGGYNTIRDLSQGNFSLHRTFLDGLMEVSPTVKKYHKVSEIISGQLYLVNASKSALQNFKNQDLLNIQELEYTKRIYDRLLKQSLENLDDLITIVTAGKLRMSDDERIREIDRIAVDLQEKVDFLKFFNQQTRVLELQRKKEKSDIQAMARQYGTPQ